MRNSKPFNEILFHESKKIREKDIDFRGIYKVDEEKLIISVSRGTAPPHGIVPKDLDDQILTFVSLSYVPICGVVVESVSDREIGGWEVEVVNYQLRIVWFFEQSAATLLFPQ